MGSISRLRTKPVIQHQTKTSKTIKKIVEFSSNFIKKQNPKTNTKQGSLRSHIFCSLEIQNTAMIILPGKCTSQFSQIASLGQRRILIIHPETSNFKQCYFLVKSLGRISCKMTIYVTTWANLQFRTVCHKSIIWRKKMFAKNSDWSLGIR